MAPIARKSVNRFSIDRSFVTSQILDTLRGDILKGSLPPGHRLIERELAESFNSSRGPIRNAFLMLEQEGLVRSLPRGGTEVIGFSQKDIQNFYAVRYNLEAMACESILKQSSSPMQNLKEIALQMSDDPHDLLHVSRLDIQFHREMVLLANNRFLLHLWETLAPIMAGVLQLTNSMWDVQKILAGHIDLAEALNTRDANVYALLKEHLSTAEKLMSELLKAKGNGTNQH